MDNSSINDKVTMICLTLISQRRIDEAEIIHGIWRDVESKIESEYPLNDIGNTFRTHNGEVIYMRDFLRDIAYQTHIKPHEKILYQGTSSIVN